MQITFITGPDGAAQTKKALAWYEHKNHIITDELSNFDRLFYTEVVVFDYLGVIDKNKISSIISVLGYSNHKLAPDVIFVVESMTKNMIFELTNRHLNFNVVPCKLFNPVNN